MLQRCHAHLLHWCPRLCLWGRWASQVPACCLGHQGGLTPWGHGSPWPLCADARDWGCRGFLCWMWTPAVWPLASECVQLWVDKFLIMGRYMGSWVWLRKYTPVVGHLRPEQARVLPPRCVHRRSLLPTVWGLIFHPPPLTGSRPGEPEAKGLGFCLCLCSAGQPRHLSGPKFPHSHSHRAVDADS